MITEDSVDWRIPIGVAIGVLLLWGLSGVLLYGYTDRGTFGDMFGAVNALFSGLAFAGVIFAILLQRRELALQRNELQLTRDELRGQRDEMQTQNKTLVVQRFENTFFHMLELHQQIVNSIDLVSSESKITSGRDCFRVFNTRLRAKWINTIKKEKGAPSGFTKQEFVNNVYLQFFADNQSDIGHYFRNMYHIIKYIDNSNVEDKKFYTNLIRAQLSSYELIILFYNCLSDLGSEKFKSLVEKYALLKNMPKDLLIDPSGHQPLYKPEAYR